MAPPTDEITTGEVSRRMDDLAGTIKDGFKDLGEKVERRPTWADVRGITDPLTKRVEKAESWGTWFSRLIGAALVAAVLSLVLL